MYSISLFHDVEDDINSFFFISIHFYSRSSIYYATLSSSFYIIFLNIFQKYIMLTILFSAQFTNETKNSDVLMYTSIKTNLACLSPLELMELWTTTNIRMQRIHFSNHRCILFIIHNFSQNIFMVSKITQYDNIPFHSFFF